MQCQRRRPRYMEFVKQCRRLQTRFTSYIIHAFFFLRNANSQSHVTPFPIFFLLILQATCFHASILGFYITLNNMEVKSTTASMIKKTCPSSSFRLRSPSLNSLRLRRIFDLFDKNGDGMITVQELSQALAILGLEVDFSGLQSTIKSHIREGNAGLAFEDFVALHQCLGNTFFGCDEGEESEMSQEESDLSEAFKVFDEDGDGYISAHELQVVLKKLGLAEGGEIDRVERMICSVDLNHDGRVDFFEFKDMMRSVVVRSS